MENKMSEENQKEVTSTGRSTQVPQIDGISIYKPTLVKEDPLPLDSSELSYASKLLHASSNGLIPVKLEDDVIIQRISRDLYSDPRSGFRELYNNEARACRIARKNYPTANPHIVVTISPSDRKLVIHGIDSMGMSQHRFLTVYTVLGRSDNFDSTEVGQFGMGRAAYTCLSDIMVLETYSRETGEKYAVMGKNGIGYNVLPQPSDLDSYGTRITITLREDININSLLKYIFRVCRFSGVRTTVELDGDINDFRDFHAGQYEVGLESMKEYIVSLREKTGDEEKLLLAVEIADDQDFYLYGEIIVDKRSWEEDYRIVFDSRSDNTYLVNVPIEYDLGYLPLSRWIINIKDERKYQPTADRERLTDAATATIRKKVMAMLKEKLQSELKLESMSDYVHSSYQILYTSSPYNNAFINILMPLLDDHTRKIVEFVNTNVKVLGNKDGRTCLVKTKIKNLINSYHDVTAIQLFCVKNIHSAAADALRENVACEVFESSSGLTGLMAKFGVRDGDLYVKENKLKRITTSKPDIITAYYRRGYNTYSEKIQVDMIATAKEDDSKNSTHYHSWKMLIAMTSEQKDGYLELMMECDTDYMIVVCSRNDVRKKKLLTGKCIFLDDFVSEVAKKQVMTSMGQMTAEETLKHIMERGMDVALFIYDDQQALAESIKKLHTGCSNDSDNRKAILSVVVPDDDSRYELKVFYRYHGVTTTLGWSDVFNKVEFGLTERHYLDEKRANMVIHAMYAFGKRYPELFELLVHAMNDDTYGDTLRLRECAFSLADILDRERNSGCKIHADPATLNGMAEISEWV